MATSATDAVQIAQNAYYAKTVFLLILLVLQVTSGNFYRPFAWPIFTYAVLMSCFFGRKLLLFCMQWAVFYPAIIMAAILKGNLPDVGNKVLPMGTITALLNEAPDFHRNGVIKIKG